MPQIHSIENLTYSIGGYGTMTFSLRALYNIVNYDASTSSYHPEITKNKKYSDDKMQELIVKLNELQLLKWRAKYETDILDGVQWEMKLNYNNSKVKKIYGSNAYPNAKFEAEVLEETPLFVEFQNALAKFIDEPSFFEDEYFVNN